MDETEIPPVSSAPGLSEVLIHLMKGVVYREGAGNSANEGRLWSALIQLQSHVRDYAAVLGLELALDEAEGYAFLRSRAVVTDGGHDAADAKLPRLIARRPLTFAVSLLLALLRKKLIEFDAGGADTRLVLTRDEIVEMVRVFMPAGTNDTRLIDQIETHLNRIADLGFVRRLKSSSAAQADTYEVRRILKAFVDAQWLSDFDARLAAYQTQLAATAQGDSHE